MQKEDNFELYDLKVEVVASDDSMICGHKEGDAFYVSGEDIIFPEGGSFSMYALAALLPLLPAKQRELDRNDWMFSDNLIACPDPNCGARFKISRVDKKSFSRADCTATPMPEEDRFD